MPVLRIESRNKRWAIVSRYSPALTAACRATPGIAFDWEKKEWVGDRAAVIRVMGLLRNKGLIIDTRDFDAFEEEIDLLPPIAEKGRRKYQLEAVKFLLSKRRCILADDMGLGKSNSAITSARAIDKNTIVICPSYVRGVWVSELKKWWPKVISVVGEGLTKNRDEAWRVLAGQGTAGQGKVLILSYDILPAWVAQIVEWAPYVVIFDECHALMSEGSKRSIAARKITESAEYVWGLSGTPMTNRPRDLWNVCDTIRPGVFGTFFKFGLRYCDAHKEAVTPTKTVWKFDGKSNLEELRERLSEFMLRRTKKDVSLELPSKTRQIVTVDVPAKAHLDVGAGAKELRRALDAAADAKLNSVFTIVRDHIAEGHKVVCFTYRRSVAISLLNAIREEDFEAEILHGGIGHRQREVSISRIKGLDEGGMLVATIDSSNTGIDLSFADVCVFAELTWEPHELLQAEARLHRFGQKNTVLIQYVIASGTSDELVAGVVVGKLDAFEVAVGSTGESLSEDLRGKEEDIMGELYKSLGVT